MKPSFFKNLGPIDIETIKLSLDCEIRNIPENYQFYDLVNIENVKGESLSFIYDNANVKSEEIISSTIICTKKKSSSFSNKQKIIIVKNVQYAIAVVSNIFYRNYNSDEILNLPQPKVGDSCEISNNAIIENGVIIGKNVKIGHGAVIKNSCFIGDGSSVGSNTVISNSILGEDVKIGSNTTIGKSGFGFFLKNFGNIKIFHTGRVILQSNVSIGSACTIDRGSFSDTTIGENTYLDNLCHVAHNVEIGSNSAFAAMTGIAGSAKIGNNVLAGGQVGIAGHIRIGNNVNIAAKSGVFHSLHNGQSVMGNPAINKYSYLRKYKKIYGN